MHLSPIDNGFWQAEYSWKRNVAQLDFVRPSSARRLDRLKVLDDSFEIFSTEKSDTVRRRDRAAFNSITIIEPMSIENSPAGYLSFAQFSDGGFLLHTLPQVYM